MILVNSMILTATCLRGYTNFLGVSKQMLLWGLVCSLRLIFALRPLCFSLLRLFDLRMSLLKVLDFIHLQGAKEVQVGTSAYMKTKVDFNGGIIFKNVSLTTGLQPILRRLSFKVQPKSRVALMGVLGSGRYNIFDSSQLTKT